MLEPTYVAFHVHVSSLCHGCMGRLIQVVDADILSPDTCNLTYDEKLPI